MLLQWNMAQISCFFYRKKYVSPISTLGHYFDISVLGQGTLPIHGLLDSGVNEYLHGGT